MADQLVVGAAIIRHGRVLVARRTRPPETAGGWELPGGKVEPGEDPDDALVREVREELGCEVRVTGSLSGESPIRNGLVLRVRTAVLVEGEPVPHEHDAVRWLGPDELAGIDWLRADLVFLTELRTLLLATHAVDGGGAVPNARAVFYSYDRARAVVDRLVGNGFGASAERERFAGEDDDEDHAWAVVSDAPGFMLDILVEEYDGWLDADGPAGDPAPDPSTPPVVRPPLDLPQAPRRIKNHFPRD